MKCPALGGRLSLIAQMVTQTAVADIGTDHAYLPVALVLSGKCGRVIASDVNAKPLEAAAHHVARYGLTEQIELRRCDGLTGFEAGEARQFIIAGMGGQLIARILEDCPFPKEGVSFLLQPMTKAGELRRYLSCAGFPVTEEQAVCEGKHVYSVMRAEYTGVPYQLDRLTERIGRVCEFPGAAAEYLKRELARLQKERGEGLGGLEQEMKERLKRYE